MNIVYMAKSAWTGLLDTIRSKAGVTGSMTVSQAADAVESISGGDGKFDELVARTISGSISGSVQDIGRFAFAYCNDIESINFPNASIIGSMAFTYCSKLTTIKFQTATLISTSAFANCSSLNNISFPAVTTISQTAFDGCKALSSVYFPNVKTISGTAFRSCINLSTASLPTVEAISTFAFLNCCNLLSLYLLGDSIVSLASTNAFNSTPISSYTTSTGGVRGSIFVPVSLYDSYKTATNWSVFSSRFVSV